MICTPRGKREWEIYLALSERSSYSFCNIDDYFYIFLPRLCRTPSIFSLSQDFSLLYFLYPALPRLRLSICDLLSSMVGRSYFLSAIFLAISWRKSMDIVHLVKSSGQDWRLCCWWSVWSSWSISSLPMQIDDSNQPIRLSWWRHRGYS